MPPPSLRSPSDIYRQFQRIIESSRKQGSRHPFSPQFSQIYFYPDDCLQQLIRQVGGVKRLLKALLPPRSLASLDDDLLLRDYPRVFSILLGLRQGQSIETFIGNGKFADRNLPFDNRSAFVELTDDEGLYEEFIRFQWGFCVPILDESTGMRWEPERILPFQVLKELGSGPTKVYLIEVDPNYNGLRERGERQSEAHSGRVNRFVLKTFDISDTDEYLHELNTYKVLKEKKVKSTSILRFYGGFHQNTTSNIILEDADLGSLDMLFRTDPPTDLEHKRKLWKNILKLLEALTYLHNLPPGGICHHDIAPRNILVCASPSSSRSSCEWSFKLADFGISRAMERVGGDSRGKAEPRTRTYGAPECFPPLDFEMELQVAPSVDIWSLACVYSEFATWLTDLGDSKSGFQRLEGYREQRSKAHTKAMRDSDSFHDGLKVLPCVSAHHQDIRTSLRRDDDTTTEKILDLVERYMLQPKLSRTDARELFLMASDQKLTTYNDPEVVSFTSPLPTISNLAPPKTVSALPSDMKTTLLSNPAPASSLTISKQSLISGNNVAETNRTTFLTFGKESSHDHFSSGNSKARTCTQAGPLFGLNRPSSSSTTSYGSGKSFTASADAFECKHCGTIREESAAGSVFNPIEIDSTPDRQLRGLSNASSQSRTAQRPNDASDIHDGRETPTRHSHAEIVPESWPVEQLHEWRKSRTRLPPGYWNGDLKDRDYVFFVDDSTSMLPHWDEVRELLHSLAYLVKEFDGNGIDLHYTHSEEKVHSSSSKELVSSVRQQQPPGAPRRLTTLEHSVGDWLENYRRRIEDHFKGWRHSLFRVKLKKTLIIVLTDGCWIPDSDINLGNTILRLASTLKDTKRNPQMIGIQFVQFGRDSDARRRLERLDNGLGLEEYDIVDTEPSDGNGFKMLVGPIQKWIDHVNEPPRSDPGTDPKNFGGEAEVQPVPSSPLSDRFLYGCAGQHPSSYGTPHRHSSQRSNDYPLHERLSSTGWQSSLSP